MKPAKHKAHVSEKKKSEMKELRKLLKEYPNIAVADMTTLPSSNLQAIRSQIRSVAKIRMFKARIVKIALEELKEDIKGAEKLAPFVSKIPALIFTKEEPFKLYRLIKQSKCAAPIKPGQVAPMDLIIPAGPTPFAPGPMLSELGAMGIKTMIEAGKIAIREDKVLVKEGQAADGKQAALLAKMGLEPMEVGLNVVAVLEKGEVLEGSVLDVDEDVYKANFISAARDSMALAVGIAYATKDTINRLIAKAYRDAGALADARKIMTSANVGEILAKADAEMAALKAKLNI